MKKRIFSFALFSMSIVLCGCSFPFEEYFPQFLKDILKLEEHFDEDDSDETWVAITVPELYEAVLKAETSPYNVAYMSGVVDEEDEEELDIREDIRLTFDDIDDTWRGVDDEGRHYDIDFLRLKDKIDEVNRYIVEGPSSLSLEFNCSFFEATCSKSNKGNFIVEWFVLDSDEPDLPYNMIHRFNKYFDLTYLGGQDGLDSGAFKFKWATEELDLNYTTVSLSEVESKYRSAQTPPYSKLQIQKDIWTGPKGRKFCWNDLSYNPDDDVWGENDRTISFYKMTNSKLNELRSLNQNNIECRKTNDGLYQIFVYGTDTKTVMLFDQYFYLSKTVENQYFPTIKYKETTVFTWLTA